MEALKNERILEQIKQQAKSERDRIGSEDSTKQEQIVGKEQKFESRDSREQNVGQEKRLNEAIIRKEAGAENVEQREAAQQTTGSDIEAETEKVAAEDSEEIKQDKQNILEQILNDSRFEDLRERYMLIEEMTNSLHREKIKKYGELLKYNQKRWGKDDIFINSVCADEQNNYKYTRGHQYTFEQLRDILMGEIIVDEEWIPKAHPD